MKKTVIKRRKRVPAVGSTGRNSPGGPSHSERNSPAPGNAPVPQTATASGVPYPTPTESEKSHPSPYGVPPSLHENRSPSIFDPIGVRRQPPKPAVPITLNNGSASERKKPWWFDDSRPSQGGDKEQPKDKDREGVSVSSYIPFLPDQNCLPAASPLVAVIPGTVSASPLSICPGHSFRRSAQAVATLPRIAEFFCQSLTQFLASFLSIDYLPTTCLGPLPHQPILNCPFPCLPFAARPSVGCRNTFDNGAEQVSRESRRFNSIDIGATRRSATRHQAQGRR